MMIFMDKIIISDYNDKYFVQHKYRKEINKGESDMDFYVMSQNKKIYEYPPHSHEMWEVLLNIEGNGISRINGQAYEFHPGTIFCIRPGVVHSKQSEEGFVDGCVLIRDFCFKDAQEDVLEFHDDERGTFYSLFRVAFQYPMDPSQDVYGERFLRSVVDAMQDLLGHWKQSNQLNPEVVRVQRILATHVDDRDLDLDAVISGGSYSPNHLRKLFREQCGCSPLRYYQKLKVQLAKKLILQNKSIKTINEIAGMCGFEDPYYFSRVFKKIEGVSPMQFYADSSNIIPKEMDQSYRYYLFDLDGTLTDPGEGITNSVMYALDKFGIHEENREELYKFIGPPLLESFQKYYGFTYEQSWDAVRYYREYFADRGILENNLYEGVREELDRLKKAGKILALATSKPEAFAVRILKHFDLYRYFDFIGAATMDEQRSRKEDVICYVLQQLQIKDRSEVLMIGDRRQDVEGAIANDIACAGVLYGYGDYQELQEAGATYIIEKPQELDRL